MTMYYLHEQHSKALALIAAGKTGLSSQALAFNLLSLNTTKTDHPHNPADFNRCLRMIYAVPAVKSNLQSMSKVSAYWEALVEHWDQIEQCFLDEAGFEYTKSTKAPKTYKLMRSVLDAVTPRKGDIPTFSIYLSK